MFLFALFSRSNNLGDIYYYYQHPASMADMRHLVDLEGFLVVFFCRFRKVQVERRSMAMFTILAIVSVFCWIVCVCATSWVVVQYVHANNITSKFYLGIWGMNELNK